MSNNKTILFKNTFREYFYGMQKYNKGMEYFKNISYELYFKNLLSRYIIEVMNTLL